MTYNNFLQETLGFIGKNNENPLGIFLTTLEKNCYDVYIKAKTTKFSAEKRRGKQLMVKMLQDQVGINYSKNGVEIPKGHQKNLMACFGNRPIHRNPLEKWFVVTKPQTEKWLAKNLPIYSEAGPVFVIGDHAFKVWFDWNLQKFLVSA